MPQAKPQLHDFEVPVSRSVQALLDNGIELARRERVKGDFGTGLLLVSLYQMGASEQYVSDRYAPRELALMLDKHSEGRFGDAVTSFFLRHRGPAEQVGADRGASANFRGVFDHASGLPMHDGILAARHLVVALLSYEGGERPANAVRLMNEAGVDRRRLLGEFLTSLVESGPEEERTRWAEILNGLDKGKGAFVPGRLRPGFGVDSASGRASDDCLDLEQTVSAMASLIASPQLDGNLSLGVFGNWGSGKSFFMRRLRGAIDELSQRARAESNADRYAATSSWPNILQAEFNAWHYVDSNLWASLVTHLLDQLRRFQPSAGAGASSALELALANLQIASSSRAEADKASQAAEKARDDAKEAMEKAAGDVEATVAELAEESAKSIWEIADSHLLDADKKAIVDKLSKLGIELEGAHVDLASLHAELTEVTSSSGRLHTALSGVLRSPGGAMKLWSLAALMVVPIVLLALGAAVTDRAFLKSAWTWIATTVSVMTVAATQALTWLRSGLASVQTLLAPLAVARRKIDAALTRAETAKAHSVAQLEKVLQARETALADARLQVAARATELHTATQAVGDLISGRTIARFVEQRIASSDYQKHLGLIALIRGDFEHLSQLVGAYNAQQLSLKDQVIELKRAMMSARPELTEGELETLFANLGVNRIVLYIDDLDRCPSARVVEVLQAIHLLLAFPLFVVVVGVDARWVAHSLATEYPNFLRAGSSDSSTGVHTADYLEKIFQIPFWVPPLRTSAARSLIRKLEPSAGPARSTGIHFAGEAISEGDPSEASTDSAESQLVASDDPRPSNGHQVPAAAASSLDPVDVQPLVLSHGEIEAMSQLAPIVGRSPRATKRFVNSYRLLRAALNTEEQRALATGEDVLRTMAAPMLMLAVVTGTPQLAARFLFPAASSSVPPTEQLLGLCDEQHETAYGTETARRVREFCEAHQSGWFGVTTQHMERWSARVAQFAFEDLQGARDERPEPALATA